MRLGPIFIVLCLSFSLCRGAPPKEVGSSSQERLYIKFTEDEDNFIVQELLRIPESAQIHGKALWSYMQAKHTEKWKQNHEGFPCKRTGGHLRDRLFKTLVHNKPNTKVKVPETLMQRFPLLDSNKPKRAPRPSYTPEETNFILEELSKPSYTLVQSSSTWETIKRIHDAKRTEGCHGFTHERTAHSLRAHMATMKQKGLLTDDILRRLPSNLLAANSRNMAIPLGEAAEAQVTSENQDEDTWVTSENQDEDTWASFMIGELANEG